MSLVDLQVEIRKIKDHLSAIELEIDRMQPKVDEGKSADYEVIAKLAKHYPLENMELTASSVIVQKDYIKALSYISTVSKEEVYNQLLYISRLAYGAKMDLSVEKIHQLGLEFDSKDLDELSIELKEIRYSLITDTLIIANLSNEAVDETLAIIADMAKILECDNEEIRVMAQVAKSVLTNDFSNLNSLSIQNSNRWQGKFKSHISQDWLASRRIYCGHLCTVKHLSNTSERQFPCVIKNRFDFGRAVKKGDVLVVYEVKEGDSRIYWRPAELVAHEIVSPCDGTVYFLEATDVGESLDKDDEYILVYVASMFDDLDSIEAWNRNNKKNAK